MKLRTLGVTLTVGLAALAPFASTSSARACGGCFHPPEGNPAPVTAHRMAVALSPTATTLWDQIEYTGDPEDFVWVLPIAGSTTVELADNAFFEALTGATMIQMRAPTPPRTSCADECADFSIFGSSFASAGSPSRSEDGGLPPVEVLYEGVVGPYETATVSSDDPAALVTWLRDHSYQVPDAVVPTIDHYVALGMNFIVLRLRPSANVDRMQPVRVTVPGLSTTFPLRMISAGVETHVALELFVFAESRIEAANFGNAEVDRAAVTYDWAANEFGYEAAFSDALFAGEGEGTNWVAEFAGAAPSSIATYESFDSVTGVEHTAAVDWAVVAAALESPYLTRLRTDLPASELDQDLNLRMSEGADIGTFIQITAELNRPEEPECATYCTSGDGTGPGSSSLRSSGDLRCSTSVGSSAGDAGIVIMLGALGAFAFRRRRNAL